MDDLYILKDRLSTAMLHRDMNGSELASKSGLQKSSVSRYLTGENIPRPSALIKMAEALDVSPAWLLGYDVPMESSAEYIRIDIGKLTEENQLRLAAYYQGLLDSQKG